MTKIFFHEVATMLSSADPELTGGVVLCIDNDQNTLECARAFLECFGYTVLTASSGEHGLELASIHSVDVVILNYFMLATKGQQLALNLRRLLPHAPIILLTDTERVPDQTVNR